MSESWRTLEKILQEHQSMVFSIALRITGERCTAEEVAQDVFLEMHRNLHNIESEAHALFWLRKVTAHRAIDAARRFVRAPETGLEAPDLPGEINTADPLLARHLQHLVAQLPEQMRAVIVLRYEEDLMPAEIAETLEMPVATVKSNLQRGLQLLRRNVERALKYQHG